MKNRNYNPRFIRNNDLVRVELWDGWFFDGNLIHDPAGNIYRKKDIEFSFFTESIVDGFCGKRSNIRTLKSELEVQIALNEPPKICLIYETPSGTIEKVFKLSEID